ncbi:hypothetical protein TARUN_2157 [Trichoderma arundinaceum]|uniref:Uncharacterized protein n=1 Tax=Trichoderma arundinaceum TaxID=490622 RepID=A0A395NVA5_TRIAR|nr:hypothetical protein TARUN_2157 [Trichoderma arundinaceum]
MANSQNFFFYAPTWDYPPGGPIKLGNVITSVKKPERPIHCVPPADSDVFSTKKMSVEHTKEKMHDGRFSILIRFFSIFGLNVSISAGLETSDENNFSFKTVETTQFVPTLSYIQAFVEADDVRRFLQMSRYRKPVYIITGLKVVTGIEANMSSLRTVRSSPAVRIDSTLPHAGPISTHGLGTESKAVNKAVTKWASSDNFVFAFRVSKVLVSQATGQVVSEEDYRKGAMFDSNEFSRQLKGPQLSIRKVEDPDAENEGFDVEELMEGEDAVLCAILRS